MGQKKIIIIGGGVAGLSAGIYAQLNGFDATIVEMHERPGGQLTAWERNGYVFDYCLHWLIGTDHGAYHHMWRETDVITEDVKIINHRTFNKYVDEQYGAFLVHTDLDEWEEYLVRFAPEDRKPIKKMCGMMRKGIQLETFENPPEMRSALEYFIWLLRAGSFIPILIKYRKRTCENLFFDLGFKNEKLVFFLNRILGSDYSALAFIMMKGWLHAKNAGYLLGGSAAMAGRMADKFTSLKGRFRLNGRAKEILVENDTVKGVKLENGEVIHGGSRDRSLRWAFRIVRYAARQISRRQIQRGLQFVALVLANRYGVIRNQ